MLEENKFSYRALLHGKDAEWYFARGLDDITAAGSYEVRLFHDDMESLGITTADCDKEHYVVAHLFVSESAATGKQQALRVVGQTLLLTICATNAVKAFTRTCEVTPKGASWGSWVDLGAASTTDIQDGAISEGKLATACVTTAKIADKNVNLAKLSTDVMEHISDVLDTGINKNSDAFWHCLSTEHAKLYIETTESNNKVSLNIQQSLPDGVIVDWGDGNIETSEGVGKIQMQHTYIDAGKQLITIANDGGGLVLGGEAENAATMTVGRNLLKKVNVGNETVRIGSYAFIYCSEITDVTIHDGVESVGRSAFNGCKSLRRVLLPNSIITLGYGSFMYCTSLEYVRMSKALTTIGQSVFNNCSSLKSINIPHSVYKIESYAFSDCSLMSKVRFYGCAKMELYAFKGCHNMQYYDFSMCESVPVIVHVNVFEGIPSDCMIIVPDNLYDNWIAATNWSTYADMIVKSSEI